MTEPTDRLRRYGEDIASAVSPARSRVAALRAIGQARPSSPRRWPRIAFATVGAFLVANVITAGVADAAVPGEALYPLDRGYEKAAAWMGIGGDHRQERIEEAEVLVDRSDFTGALALLTEATEDTAVQDAVATLRAQGGSDPDLPEHVEELVTGLHEWAAARRAGETDDMAEAVALIRLITSQIGDNAPPSSPDQVGPPDHADEPGSPEGVGEERPPAHSGTQGQGPPDEPGQQGSPDRTGNQGQGPPDPAGGRGGGSGDGSGPPEGVEPPGVTNPRHDDGSPNSSDGSGPPNSAGGGGSSGRGSGRR